MHMSKEVEFKNRDRFIQLGITIAALRKMQRHVPGEVGRKGKGQQIAISSIEAAEYYSPLFT